MRYLDPECKFCGMVHWQKYDTRFMPKVCIAALKEELQRARHNLGSAQYSQRRLSDLEVVVRDQRRHIANLEDQLLGFTKPDTGKQEAFL